MAALVLPPPKRVTLVESENRNGRMAPTAMLLILSIMTITVEMQYCVGGEGKTVKRSELIVFSWKHISFG